MLTRGCVLLGEAYSRPVTHLAFPRVGGLNHVGAQGQGCNQSCTDTLNSKKKYFIAFQSWKTTL